MARAKRFRTMFFKPKTKKYAKIIELDDPQSAKGSVNKLKREYNKAKTKAKKRKIIRVTTLASNRAKAMGKKRNLSKREKTEFKRISNIYKKAGKTFSQKY